MTWITGEEYEEECRRLNEHEEARNRELDEQEADDAADLSEPDECVDDSWEDYLREQETE